MAQLMLLPKRIIGFLTLVTMAAACQAQGGLATRGQSQPSQQDAAVAITPHAAEDISGMYTFLKDGEYLQINLEKTAVTGYVSSIDDSDNDTGVFLDQFFSKADVQGHEVSFTTMRVHGVWYEFKGKFDRGPGTTKSVDGYYILRGTLKEFTANGDKSVATRSREVEFKLLAQPDDSDQTAAAANKGKKQKN